MVDFALDVAKIQAKGLSAEKWSAMLELRNQLAGENVEMGWHIVICEDPERKFGEDDDAVKSSNEGVR